MSGITGKISGDAVVPFKSSIFVPGIDMSLAVGSQNVKLAASSFWPFNTPLLYGAVGDGVHDDTAAIQACFNASVGGNVYFPPGTYNTTGNLVVPGEMTIAGAGRTSTNLLNTNAATKTLAIQSDGVTVRDIFLGNAAGITPTGPGALIDCETFNDIWIYNFSMKNFFQGIQITGPGTVHVHNGTMYNPVQSTPGLTNGSGCIYMGNGDGVLVIDDVTMACSPTKQCAYGMLIASCAFAVISNCQIVGCGYDLMLVPSAGQEVDSVWAHDTFFDTATIGISITPSGTGSVNRARFTGCWTCSHSQSGVEIYGPNVHGVHFIDHHGSLNAAGSGIYVSGGTDITVLGGIFAGNLDGLLFDVGTSDFSIIGASSGNYGTFGANSNAGIIVGAGASDRYIITNNRLHGNGGIALQDSGTGGNKSVTGNVL